MNNVFGNTSVRNLKKSASPARNSALNNQQPTEDVVAAVRNSLLDEKNQLDTVIERLLRLTVSDLPQRLAPLLRGGTEQIAEVAEARMAARSQGKEDAESSAFQRQLCQQRQVLLLVESILEHIIQNIDV